MTLEKLNDHNYRMTILWNNINNNTSIKNGIECPVCKEELFDSNPMQVLCSIPPQKNIHCEKCKYSGFRIA